MIRGYAEQPSPRAGGSVTLRVSTDAPQFRVELYRCGAERVLCESSTWLPGEDAPAHLPFQDWGQPGVGLHGEPLAPWPAYPVPVPGSWAPGVYLAVLVEGDGSGRDRSWPDRSTSYAPDGAALFVVRPGPSRPAAPILYKVPLLTYSAYALLDGVEYDPATRRGSWCFYNRERLGELAPRLPAGVNLHRPGGGTGAVPYDTLLSFDPFDPTPRQTFAHWDARFVGWLEREGYQVDYCTDLDFHRGGAGLLSPYRLLVSAGHDEYWSDSMRAAVEEHVATGGSVAFFSGNTCWWRVVFDDDVTFSRRHHWWDPDEAYEPENTLTGVSFRNGGERDRDDHPVPVGYRVQHADHWVWAGTGVRDGDVVGGGPGEYLVGYECDGADFDRGAYAVTGVAEPTGTDGTPPGFTILGVGDVQPYGWGFGNSAATMGLHTRPGGGTVFTAATTDWPRVLTAGTASTPAVEQVTRNVLDRLSR